MPIVHDFERPIIKEGGQLPRRDMVMVLQILYLQ